MQTTANRETLDQALKHVNNMFNDNIVYKTITQISSKRISFTLTVKTSKNEGGRIGHTGRRVAAACWHVHGYFFEKVWELEPEALIIAGSLRMTGEDDNWQDRNIGSVYQPMMYSEACNC